MQRTRLRPVLGRVELRPPGLPTESVLLVRRASIEVPAAALGPWAAASATGGWPTRTRDRLGSALSGADRPTDGDVRSTSDAVLFRDRSELLACLVLDTAHERTGERWWWRAWGGSEVGELRLPQLLVDEVAAVPAVFDQLARWGRVGEVVAALRPTEASRVLAALLATFGLTTSPGHHAVGTPGSPSTSADGSVQGPPGRQARSTGRRDGGDGELGDRRARTPSGDGVVGLTARPGAQGPEDRRGTAGTRDEDPSASAGVGPAVRRDGAWRSALASIPPGVDGPLAALAVSALLLARSPRLARRRDVRVLLSDTTHPCWANSSRDRRPRREGLDQRPGALRASGVAPPGAAADRSRSGDDGAQGRGDPQVVDAPAGDGQVGGGTRHVHVAGERSDRRGMAPPRHGTEDGPEAGTGGALSSAARRRSSTDHRPDAPAHEGTAAADATADPADADQGVATALAGVCYLANLFEPLGLPDVADPGWRLDELSGWALIEVLGRGLLSDAADDLVARDPIWSVLASLDGRPPDDPIGLEVLSPPDDALPVAWREDASTHGAELPFPGEPGSLVTDRVVTGTAAWLAGVLPYLRWRLRDALGEVAPAAVLRARGRLIVTRTHVDVVIPLADVSLPARLAGLDRSPGWLPLLGRVLTVHFVEKATL